MADYPHQPALPEADSRWPQEERRKVLVVCPDFSPSTWIGILNPPVALHASWQIDLRVVTERSRVGRRADWPDVVVFNRNCDPRHVKWHERLLDVGTPCIYELDDNFFESPRGSSLERSFGTSAQIACLRRYLQAAALVRVYSSTLRERVAALNPHTAQVVAAVEYQEAREPSRDPSAPLKIVYPTSRAPDERCELFVPAVSRVLDRYRGQVEMHFLGYGPRELRHHPHVRFHRFHMDYLAFLRDFARAGYDIGLAPLVDDPFHRSKTNNKFREFGACRIAGIYSNIDVYSSCVTDGETGLLVNDRPEEWYHAIVRLVEDHALRRAIQARARSYVEVHYAPSDAQATWLRQIDEVRRRSPEAVARIGADTARRTTDAPQRTTTAAVIPQIARDRLSRWRAGLAHLRERASECGGWWNLSERAFRARAYTLRMRVRIPLLLYRARKTPPRAVPRPEASRPKVLPPCDALSSQARDDASPLAVVGTVAARFSDRFVGLQSSPPPSKS